MIPLPTITATQAHRDFGSIRRPLRPSSIPKLFKCPMSVFMSTAEDNTSNGAADTGSMVHAGAAAYHKTEGDVQFRKEVGDNAVRTSLPEFPQGNLDKALAIFEAYAADPANQTAVVPWVEEKVTLTLQAAANDPTGEDIIISGTLDQVRAEGEELKILLTERELASHGVGGAGWLLRTNSPAMFSPYPKLSVWDIKTGSGKDANETNAEYVLQQCVYTLAARETLNPLIVPGGFIYTPGYDKPRGRRFLPLGISVDQCILLLAQLPQIVSLVRQGFPMFSPSAGACQYCPVRPYSNCLSMYQGVYS